MNLKKYFSPIYPIFIFFLVNLVVLSISRFALALWQMDRVNEVHGWMPLFIQGLRIDVSSLCWLFTIPVILAYFFAGNNAFGRVIQWVIRLYLVASSIFIVFMELSTPAFINTYDFRPNRLFVEYLVSPREVFSTLAEGHTFATIATFVLTLLFTYLFWQLAKKVSKNIVYPQWYARPFLFLLVAAIMFLGARSSLQHRALNPSMVAFSSDPLVNSLILNSGYSLAFAVNQMRSEANASELYGKMPLAEVIKTIKTARGRPNSDYISEQYPTVTYNQASYQGKPKNLVIILEESFGAQFIGALGDKRGLSPAFDKLAQQGWLLDNLYATGTRSVRGIEAIITGFMPTPARSVVKLPLSQHNFFTIADVLKQKGYKTSFIYGGEKHFDNMASFFYGNGFDYIIDQQDYKNPKFVATWGVSDEDLFNRANQEFTQWQKEGKPFFSLVFSSSNHDPFDYPAGKIKLYDKQPNTRNNAAKYADYAIGHFFKLAKQSNYWKDTVFLIIADHDSRVHGSTLVPIDHFHIPALILGAGIESKRDHRLVSQMDMPTTLLSLIGVNANYPMLGYDLTQPQDPNRALMQFDKNLAYMKGDQVAILQPKVQAKGFKWDAEQHKLVPAAIPEEMKKQALAYALWGSYAYRKQLHQAVQPSEENKPATSAQK